MTDAPLIRLSAITKTYGRGQAAFQALKGIDLLIGQGDFVAIMGPSGSGKSTAMNILGCLDTPSSGSYEFQGVHVERLTRNQRALLRRNYLGFVFQGFNLLARTTALENVELPLIYRGEAAAARHAAARAALAQVGLQGWEDHTPGELSGGQQQRVAIARALAQEPRLIVADEPVASLDPSSAAGVMQLLKDIARDEGVAVICSLHQVGYARTFTDRVIGLARGRVVVDAPTQSLDEAAYDALYGSADLRSNTATTGC